MPLIVSVCDMCKDADSTKGALLRLPDVSCQPVLHQQHTSIENCQLCVLRMEANLEEAIYYAIDTLQSSFSG
jgi:hypothetical protein